MGASAQGIAGVVSGSLLVGVGMAAYGYLGSQDRDGVVERVVDGDTIVVQVAGETRTIGLLNIAAPEIVEASAEPQCMATEAAEWLEERLPAGTSVELRYARELIDTDGRTLAGVFADGALVNAELTAAGLGVPVYSADGNRYWPEAQAGFEDAQMRQSGLFDPSIDCTLPARISDAVSAAGSIPAEYATGISLDDAAAKVADVASTATALKNGDLERLGAAVFKDQADLIAAATETADKAHEMASASYNSLLASAEGTDSLRPSVGQGEVGRGERQAREPGSGLEAAPATPQRFAPAGSASESSQAVAAPEAGGGDDRKPEPTRGLERAAEVKRGTAAPSNKPTETTPAPAAAEETERVAAPAKPTTPPGLQRAAEVTTEPVVTENRKPATPPGLERAAEVAQRGADQSERKVAPGQQKDKSAAPSKGPRASTR